MMFAVDVFPLLCHLLDIPTQNSNGSLATVRHLLRHLPSQTVQVIKDLVTYYTKEKRLPMTGSSGSKRRQYHTVVVFHDQKLPQS